MKKTSKYKPYNFNYIFENPLDLNKVLYIDIETTGLNAKSDYIYMIGLGFFCKKNDFDFELVQLFAPTLDMEESILYELAGILKNYTHLIHFNGLAFDLPFIEKRAEKYNIELSLEGLVSLDLYKKISPYKTILNLEKLNQKAIEKYLGIYREDKYSGLELIKIYKEYLSVPSKEYEDLLFLHNLDDLRGMLDITNILSITDLLEGKNIECFEYRKNKYIDYLGEVREEFLIIIFLKSPLLRALNLYFDDIRLIGDKNKVILKIPIEKGELKYFYDDYKEYYYLEAEDLAIHKSLAKYVDKEFKDRANKKNCYTKKASIFLPEYEEIIKPVFKKTYEDKNKYFELTDTFLANKADIEAYMVHMLMSFGKTKSKKPVRT